MLFGCKIPSQGLPAGTVKPLLAYGLAQFTCSEGVQNSHKPYLCSMDSLKCQMSPPPNPQEICRCGIGGAEFCALYTIGLATQSLDILSIAIYIPANKAALARVLPI